MNKHVIEHWDDFLERTSTCVTETRSGKIMRRILRKMATDEIDTIGDTSTLAEPEVVDSLIFNKGEQARSSLSTAGRRLGCGLKHRYLNNPGDAARSPLECLHRRAVN